MIHAQKSTTTSTQHRSMQTNPLLSIDDAQLMRIADCVRATGLHHSADAIEMRLVAWGDGCTLVGTIKLLQLMAEQHKRTVWHAPACRALMLLSGATTELARWSAAVLSTNKPN